MACWSPSRARLAIRSPRPTWCSWTRLARLGAAAGVEHAALHRLRHGVATYLVGHGRLLKAQARLGHCDPATTRRHYSHAIPLDDTDVADELDRLLNDLAPESDHSE